MKQNSIPAALIISLALLLGLLWQPVSGQSIAPPGVWATNGPSFGEFAVNVLVTDPDDPARIFAGTEGKGVFLSTNGGVTWSQANPPMDTKLVKTMLFKGDTLFAGTAYTAIAGVYIPFTFGVWYSIDGGVNWRQGQGNIGNEDVVFLLSVSGMIYAGTSKSLFAPGGVHSSRDGGVSWQNTNLASEFSSMAATPDTIFVATKDKNFYKKSVRGNDSWVQLIPGIQFNLIDKAFHQDDIAFAQSVTVSSVEGAGLEGERAVDGDPSTRWSSQHSDPQFITVDLGSRTTINGVHLRWEAAYGKEYEIQVSDNGAEWTTAVHVTNGNGGVDEHTFAANGRYLRMYGRQRGTPSGYSLWDFEVLRDNSNPPLFVGYEDGVGISWDGGSQWYHAELFGNNILRGNSISGLKYVNKTLYAWSRTTEKLFWLDDPDVSKLNWQEASYPQSGVEISAFAGAGNTIYAATKGQGIFRSTDKGLNWIRSGQAIDDKEITAMVVDLPELYCGTTRNGVFKGVDEGSNWYWTPKGQLSLNEAINAFFAEENIVIAYGASTQSTSGNAFTSLDGGRTWVPNSLPGMRTERGLIVSSKGVLYAATDGNGVYRSFDGGITWNPANTGVENESIQGWLVTDNALYALGLRGLWRSEDGVNWKAVTMNPLPRSGVVSAIQFNGALYAGMAWDGVYRSTDGATWTQVLEGMPYWDNPTINSSVLVLLALNGTLYAGTSNSGIYYSTNGVNWTHAIPPVDNIRVHDFVAVGDTLYAAADLIDRGEILARGAYVSYNGRNWEQITLLTGEHSITRDLHVVGRTVFLAGEPGVYYGRGNNPWRPLSTGFSDKVVRVSQLGYNAATNTLLAATSEGVYFQEFDSVPPIAESINISNEAAYTNQRKVSLTLSAEVPDSMISSVADSMIISENSRFAGAKWQEYDQIVEDFPLLPGDGLKTIYAKFKDFAWNESKTISTQIFLDQTAPDFSPYPHAAPPPATRGKNIAITQQVEEPNLEKMELWYRRLGEPWSEDRVSNFNPSWTAVIDSVFIITPRGLDYRIIALDKAGNRDTLKAVNGMDFFPLPVSLNVGGLGASSSLPSGTGGAAYRIVSAPMNLDGSLQTKNVFKGLGKYGRRGDWLFYSYTGNGQWQEGDNISMQAGTAYFMIRRTGGSLTNAVTGTTTPSADGVLGRIPGWQLRAGDWTPIGNPYNARIALNQLKLKRQGTRLSQPGTTVQVWEYDGSWKNPTTNPDLALQPWSGLFVRVTQTDTIVFANAADPYQPITAGKAGAVPVSFLENLAEKEWLVQITAASGEFADDANYLGVKKEAKDELDNLDWYEPPFLPGGVSLSFPHAAWNDPAELTADFRSIAGDGQRWEIIVKGEQAHAVQLNFSNIETVPEDLQILLVDETTKIVRDLRQEPNLAVRIPADAKSRTLTVMVGNELFISKNTEGMLSVPATFALHQNYPNPFNPSTTIRYQLPVAGRVTLKIFDIMGREVLALEENKSHEPGYYEMVADMNTLGSGVYFYRIAVAGEQKFQATKKMLFVK